MFFVTLRLPGNFLHSSYHTMISRSKRVTSDGNGAGAEELEEGQQVYLQNEMGQPFPVTVVAKEAGIITFDANHEMAGKELNFKIELVEIC